VEKSKVYFGSIQHGRDALFASLGTKFTKILDLLDLTTIGKGDKVAIKMHLGFNEGFQTIPVFFIRRLVKAVKTVGGVPFITDNPTAVYNAVERGYTQETCGCPLVPVAGIKDGYTFPVEINYGNVDSLNMGGVLHDADVLIDAAHAKGHGNCGYGGVIKNLALGGFEAKSRWNKIHGVENSIPWWDAEKCSPEHAQTLVESCPYGAFTYNKEKHKLSMMRFKCHNTNCLECLKADENVGSLKIAQENFAAFQELMVINSGKILNTFDKEKQFFLNFGLEITAHCDCMGFIQPVIVNDVGILGSRDIIALENATLDLIKKEGIIEQSIPPYFKHLNLDPTVDLHPFERIWGQMKNPYQVVKYGEKHGLGHGDYELIEVLSPAEAAIEDPSKYKFEGQMSFY
jgi:uncharacterized Fe-S center protein